MHFHYFLPLLNFSKAFCIEIWTKVKGTANWSPNCTNIQNFFTQQDQIAEKEWISSIRSAHKTSQELLGSITNKKVGKIYGTDTIDAAHKNVTINSPTGAIQAKNTNGSN